MDIVYIQISCTHSFACFLFFFLFVALSLFPILPFVLAGATNERQAERREKNHSRNIGVQKSSSDNNDNKQCCLNNFKIWHSKHFSTLPLYRYENIWIWKMTRKKNRTTLTLGFLNICEAHVATCFFFPFHSFNRFIHSIHVHKYGIVKIYRTTLIYLFLLMFFFYIVSVFMVSLFHVFVSTVSHNKQAYVV